MNDVAGDATVQGEFFDPAANSQRFQDHALHIAAGDLTLSHLHPAPSTHSGDISVSFDIARLRQELAAHDKDIEVENVAGRLDIAGTHGDIKVTYAQPPSAEINIANGTGKWM